MRQSRSAFCAFVDSSFSVCFRQRLFVFFGFYTWSFNLNAFKRWHLGYGETGPYFQLEAYMRNILNHPNRGGPSSTNINSPAFGQFRLGGARNIQIRLRIGL